MEEKVTRLIDDLTGKPIPEGKGRTVILSLDRKTRRLDLSAESYKKLAAVIDPFLVAGYPVATDPAGPSKASQKRSRKAFLSRVREWAPKNGYPPVPERGRVPQDIITAYTVANPGDDPTRDPKNTGKKP